MSIMEIKKFTTKETITYLITGVKEGRANVDNVVHIICKIIEIESDEAAAKAIKSVANIILESVEENKKEVVLVGKSYNAARNEKSN